MVQGSGCLNYALVLRIAEGNSTHSISAANRFIMERNRAAIQSALSHLPSGVSVCGHTDLAVGDLKFSGNAQRRRKNFLLFHGTLLLDFDLKLVGELLNMPSLQPDYRGRRPHGEFVTNLGIAEARVKHELSQVWGANEAARDHPVEQVARLVAEKYSRPEWNQKF